MSKHQYELKINTRYLRTEDSNSVNREQDPVEGKCNNFNDRKEDGKPTWIIEHHTVSNFDRSVNIFLKGSASTHYMIAQDGEVFQFVADEKRAYHAGPGALKFNSKLNNNYVTEETLKGRNKDSELGKGSGDMNSWSIGIENVNSAFEPFTEVQTQANIHLHEKLINEFGINPKNLLSHAEWALGRKVDPSPYYNWKALANASKLEGIDHNFGVYSDISQTKDSEIVASYLNKDSKEDIQQIQTQLTELGYAVLEPDDANLGIYDQKTRDGAYAFTIHYMNESIINNHEKLGLWNLVDYKVSEVKEMARNEIAIWTTNHHDILGDILHLMGD